MKTDRIVQARDPRPRGFIDWHPAPASEALLAAVQGVLEANAAYLPMTGRQIFYGLVARDQVDKTERGYKRLLELLVKGRRSSRIPFWKIRDDGEQSAEPELCFSSAAQVRATAQSVIDNAIFDPDAGQEYNQIVLCEAAGMLPQLGRVASEFGVTALSSGGFNSVTVKRNFAQRIDDDGRPAVVWHLGDYDPSGVHVYQSFVEDVEAFVEGVEVTFKRLAVTPGQIEQMGLPSAPTKASDNRAFDGLASTQCEAIPPDRLGEILKTALASLWDTDVYETGRDEFEAEL
jgi:hypothetical protein